MHTKYNKEECSKSLESRDYPDRADQTQSASDTAPDNSKESFVNGRSGTGQRNDQRSVKHRVNPIVIARCVEQVADHPRQGDFKSELHVPRIAKGVRHKKGGLTPGCGFLRVVLRLRISAAKILERVFSFPESGRYSSGCFCWGPCRSTRRNKACLEFLLKGLCCLFQSA